MARPSPQSPHVDANSEGLQTSDLPAISTTDTKLNALAKRIRLSLDQLQETSLGLDVRGKLTGEVKQDLMVFRSSLLHPFSATFPEYRTKVEGVLTALLTSRFSVGISTPRSIQSELRVDDSSLVEILDLMKGSGILWLTNGTEYFDADTNVVAHGLCMLAEQVRQQVPQALDPSNIRQRLVDNDRSLCELPKGHRFSVKGTRKAAA